MSRIFVNAQTGSNETYIKAAASAVYNSLPKATIGFWVYLTAGYAISGAEVIIKDPKNTVSTSIAINGANAVLNGAITPSVGGIGASFTNESVPLNTWTYVTMYFDFTGDKKVYFSINGVPCTYSAQTAAGGSTPIDDSGDGWYFGNDTFDDGLSGNLADVAIWNTVLTGPQITSASASTTGVGSIASGNLVGYWHLCGLASPEPDSSGNANSGTLNGTPPPGQGANSPGYSACGGSASLTVFQITTPSTGRTSFTDTILGAVPDCIFSKGFLFSISVDNSANSASSYVKIYSQSDPVIVGSSSPKMVLKIPAGKIITQNFAGISGAPGVYFANPVSMAAVTTGGISGNSSPVNPVICSMTYR